MNITIENKTSPAGKLLHFNKGEIVISLLFPCKSTFNDFEIYCPELFDDVERFSELSEALEKIFNLLNSIK